MLGFIKKCIFTGLAFLSTLTSIDTLNCLSMINQECRIRPQIVNVNGDDPLFFPFSIKTSKCSGSCNSSNNLHANNNLHVPDVVKNLNVKVFNLMTRNVNVDQTQVFIIINNIGMMINAGVNAKD